MIIYTQGSFDILHSGHMNLLSKCRRLAGDGKVVIALLSDKSYESYRGYPPAKPYAERKRLLEAIRFVDEVWETDHTKTREQILKLKPDFVVIGSDWVAKDLYTQYRMTPEELNPLLIYFPYTMGITSTMIKERIKNGT
jgi:glycerol-3-phosphate cytidylyltransferase